LAIRISGSSQWKAAADSTRSNAVLHGDDRAPEPGQGQGCLAGAASDLQDLAALAGAGEHREVVEQLGGYPGRHRS
jgi:hypothetical protein